MCRVQICAPLTHVCILLFSVEEIRCLVNLLAMNINHIYIESSTDIRVHRVLPEPVRVVKKLF